jgi:hypothetical protein
MLILKSIKRINRILGIYFIIIFMQGCGVDRTQTQANGYYYLNPNNKNINISRVAIVELGNDSGYPQIAEEMTNALFESLQKKQLFGLTIVRKRDDLWKSLQLDSDITYSLNQMNSIREMINCDGVLVGTITEFKPYPHMVIGLRLKLMDLKDGQLIWAIEQVWNSSDKYTQKSIKNYLENERDSSQISINKRLATISPLEFIKYISYETAKTL